MKFLKRTAKTTTEVKSSLNPSRVNQGVLGHNHHKQFCSQQLGSPPSTTDATKIGKTTTINGVASLSTSFPTAGTRDIKPMHF